MKEGISKIVGYKITKAHTTPLDELNYLIVSWNDFDNQPIKETTLKRMQELDEYINAFLKVNPEFKSIAASTLKKYTFYGLPKLK